MDRLFEHSSSREEYLEYIFLGELSAEAWKRQVFVEILRSNTDAFGYDLVLECGGIIRHVQLKSSHLAAKTSRQSIGISLANKPSGCVIWLLFDAQSLKLQKYRWFGGKPGAPLPDLGERLAKHSKGNAQGVKLSRPNHRMVSRGKFVDVGTISEVFEHLFG